METYINSSNITAFPVGRRQGDNNKNGTLLTESRLSSIVNSLLDINGFVVFPNIGTAYLIQEIPETPSSDNHQILSVNILGRLFKIDYPYRSMGLSDGSVVDDSVYVGIKIDTRSNEIYYEVDGDDGTVTNKYSGLKIFSSIASSNGDNTYSSEDGYTCVKVAVWDGTNWVIPEPEYSKVNYIDAGELEEPQQNEE